MTQTLDLTAAMLNRCHRALAAYAASDLLDARPQAAEAFPDDPHAGWTAVFDAQLCDLAAAVSAHRPRLLVEPMQIERERLAARGVDADHLRRGVEGLRAVLVRELPEEASAPAVRFLDSALSAFGAAPAGVGPRLAADDVHSRLAAKYLLAVFEGDRRRASRLVLDAASAGVSIADLYLRVLVPAQEELGRMWMADEINVAEEHFASQTTRMVMAQLLPLATCRPPNGKTFLAAAVAGNYHDLGVQVISDFFEMDGWRVISLGHDMPIVDLVQAIGFYEVDLAGLSAAIASQLPTLKEAIATIRAQPHGPAVKILVGGGALSRAGDLAAELGADGYAPGPLEAVSLGRRLVGLAGVA